MLKPLACLVLALFVPLAAGVEAQQCTAAAEPLPPDLSPSEIVLAQSGNQMVPIRSAPPNLWRAGFPGGEVARVEAGDCYEIVAGLEVHAFGSREIWVEIEQLTAPGTERKAGWINWSESLDEPTGSSFVHASVSAIR